MTVPKANSKSNGKRKYQEVWEILRNRTVMALRDKTIASPLLIELNMPAKTFSKAISKEKNNDTAFKRAFPNATLECTLVHVPNAAHPEKTPTPHMQLKLNIIPKLTADMFEQINPINPFSVGD